MHWNMIFQNEKFQVDDIKGKAFTPYVTPSSRVGENFIHVTYEISFCGIDKLLKKEEETQSSWETKQTKKLVPTMTQEGQCRGWIDIDWSHMQHIWDFLPGCKDQECGSVVQYYFLFFEGKVKIIQDEFPYLTLDVLLDNKHICSDLKKFLVW